MLNSYKRVLRWPLSHRTATPSRFWYSPPTSFCIDLKWLVFIDGLIFYLLFIYLFIYYSQKKQLKLLKTQTTPQTEGQFDFYNYLQFNVVIYPTYLQNWRLLQYSFGSLLIKIVLTFLKKKSENNLQTHY